MYSIDGDFGKVRRIYVPPRTQNYKKIEIPFYFNSGGWHNCNKLYRIERECGKKGHLLLFSLNDGGILHLHGNSPIQIPAYTVAWIPPQRGHAYYTIPDKLWEFYWLDVAEDEILHFAEIFDENSLLYLPNMDLICKEMEHLLIIRNLNRQDFQVESSRTIGNIYHYLLQKSLSNQKTGKQDELVLKIIRNMESTYESELSLLDLSSKYFISVPQLIRRFKDHTGMTPHAYLMLVRLQAATTYLQHTNLSIEEISHRIGFPSTSNFILQFRKRYGIAPSKYRKSQ